MDVMKESCYSGCGKLKVSVVIHCSECHTMAHTHTLLMAHCYCGVIGIKRMIHETEEKPAARELV